MIRNPTPRFGDPMAPWHYWFAWRPVASYDGRWTWLRSILRRRIQKHSSLDGGADQWWQYQRTDGYAE